MVSYCELWSVESVNFTDTSGQQVIQLGDNRENMLPIISNFLTATIA
jgi:fibrillarin-like rRNA methylase